MEDASGRRRSPHAPARQSAGGVTAHPRVPQSPVWAAHHPPLARVLHMSHRRSVRMGCARCSTGVRARVVGTTSG
eukprot:3264934-Prymnesium_polylepis.2